MFHPSLGDINVKPFAAEFMGTFWLVLGGCGSAVLAAAFPNVGIGLLGVALAFGLTVLTMAYAIGHISGCHLNPAVTLGLWAGGRFPASGVLSYIVAQVLGGIAAAAVLYVIASGQAGFDLAAGFAKQAPYDVILISGAIEELPQAIADQLKEGGRIGAIFDEGMLGVARIGHKIDGAVNWRYSFNGSAPVLPAFRKTETFQF